MADASKSNGHDSDSISTVSKDTLSPPSLPAWESSILGNTIEPKKSRKNERDLQNVSWANLKSPKQKDKKTKEEKRAEKAAKKEKKKGTAKDEVDPDVKNAAILEISVEKYQKKLASGQIKFVDGTPVYVSKKELKKEKKVEKVETPSKKRKLEDDGDKSEKKKKKKSKA